jgi:hypothetical protein
LNYLKRLHYKGVSEFLPKTFLRIFWGADSEDKVGGHGLAGQAQRKSREVPEIIKNAKKMA